MCEFFITLYKQRHPWRSVAPFLSFCFKNKAGEEDEEEKEVKAV